MYLTPKAYPKRAVQTFRTTANSAFLLAALCLTALLSTVPVNAQRFVKVVNTVDELVRLNPTDVHTNVFVADLERGGMFVLATRGTTNSGTAFASTNATRQWNRQVAAGDEVSVKWFGAKGNGVADDTAAIQATITWAATNAYPLIFPAGTYRHTANLNFGYRRMRVYGKGEVILQAVGSFSPCVSIDAGLGTLAYDTALENISIYGSGAANQTGFYTRNAPHKTVKKVRIKNVSLYGVHILGDVLSTYEEVVLGDELGATFGAVPTTSFRIEDSDMVTFTTDCTFLNCIIEKGSVYGWHLVKANENVWIGGTSEGLTVPGTVALRIDATSSDNIFKGFFMEGNSGGDVVVYGNRNSFENSVTSSSAPVPPHADVPGITLKTGSYLNTFKGGYAYQIVVETNALNNAFERVYVQNLIDDQALDSNFTEKVHCLERGISDTIFPGTRWVDWLRIRPIGGVGIFAGIKHDTTDLIATNNTGHIRLNATTGSQVQPNRLTVPGATDIQEGISLSGVNSPTSFGASANDVDIGSAVSMLRAQSSLHINITGIVGPTRNGHLLTVHNVGSFSIALVQEDPASIATNRFASPAKVLQPGDAVLIQYDMLAQRWRILSTGQNSFTTGIGLTNINNVLSGNYTPGTNMVAVTNANGQVSWNVATNFSAGTNIVLGVGLNGATTINVQTNFSAGTNIVFGVGLNGATTINVATNAAADTDGYTLLPIVTTTDGTLTPIYTNSIANNTMVVVHGEVDAIDATRDHVRHVAFQFLANNNAGTMDVAATSFQSQVWFNDGVNYAVTASDVGTTMVVTVQNNAASPNTVKWQMRYKVVSHSF